MHRPILSVHAPRLRRALPLAAGLALALPLGAGALAAPAASAATTSCRVVDTSGEQSYASLPDAVNAPATSPGDTLFVKGTCTGVTDITKSLTITGQSNGTQKTATLNGGGQGSVLTIDSGVTVTLNTLIITGGGNGYIGGGIYNAGGTVTLNGSTVTGNTAGYFGDGGGIVNAVVGGGVISPGGTVTLNDSTVTNNTASTYGQGGGIYNYVGTVALNGSSIITGNTAFSGGGIYNQGSTVTLNGSSTITGNTATQGGGIDSCSSGTLNGAVAAPATGANVYNNHPDNIYTDPFC